MEYIITGETMALALGEVSQSATDVQDALRKARQMYDIGFVNVTIKNEGDHKIDGDELLACIMGTKSITEDLQAK